MPKEDGGIGDICCTSCGQHACTVNGGCNPVGQVLDKLIGSPSGCP